MGCRNNDFSPGNPWKLFFSCMRTPGNDEPLMSRSQVINQMAIFLFYGTI